jgi:hypothetical protein
MEPNPLEFIEEVDKPRYTGFILLVMFLGAGIYFISGLADMKNIKDNWEKYRCSPSVMPFASLYGQDTQETFSFCMKNMFSGYAGELLGPFYGILGGFVKALMTLIKSANSIRLMIASLFGGITTIMQEFTTRFSQFMMRIRISAMRIKFMMYRVMGMMMSVLFIGLSGITSALNFGDTALFGLLDMLSCFPTHTVVDIKQKGKIPIKDVRVGDVFNDTDGTTVTSVFRFYSDGVSMMKMPDGTEVSSTHYIWDSDMQHWYKAYNHPDALPNGSHTGGFTNPLICLNTNTHKIPIGDYIYRDFDETDEADIPCGALVEKRVNGYEPTDPYNGPFESSLHPATPIKVLTSEGIEILPISAIQPGMKLSNNGIVVAKIEKKVTHAVRLTNGYVMAASTLVWSPTAKKWVRAEQTPEALPLRPPPKPFITLIVSNSVIEGENGTLVRDYIEIFSQEIQAGYDDLMKKIPL